MSFLKPKAATSTQSSNNVNNGLITSTYGGQMGAGTGATNFIAQLLGVGGGGGGGGGTAPTQGAAFDYRHDGIKGNAAAARAAGQPDHGFLPGSPGTAGGGAGGAGGGDAMAGYNNYLQLAGYAPAMKALSQNITGQGAASGILNSGSTAKALQSRGADLNHQYFNNYMQQLAGLSGLGLQAGQLAANTGQQSTGTSQGGGPSTLGSIASIAGSVAPLFSDRRLKRSIELVRREADGLGIYLCRYVWSRTRRLMVMADEVAKLRPWALGPVRAGYQTVIYGAL
jgi:hypothetical protein